MTKISEKVVERYRQLREEVRDRVDEIVRAHYRFCWKQGVQSDVPVDRLYIEAMDVAELEIKVPELRTDWVEGDDKTQGMVIWDYDQYRGGTER